MLQRFHQAAGNTASQLSRRQFVSRFGRAALGMTAVLGGVLALPRPAAAGKTCRVHTDCPRGWTCSDETARCVKTGGRR